MINATLPDKTRTTGVLLVLVSAFVFSTAGIFTNGVASSAWTVIFWRGLAAATFTFIYLGLRGLLAHEIRLFGKPALLATVFMAVGTAAFIPAFKLSSVANVVLIYAAAPFVAAGLSWVFLKEIPSQRIIIASIVAFVGVLVIVSGSVGQTSLIGDLLAFCMTLMMAATMVVYRAYPGTPAALPAALASVVLLPVAVFFGDPLNLPQGEFPILVAFGFIFAIASVTLNEGARRLPSPETALLSSLEVPIAPLLAWLILSESPSIRVLFGGVIIFLAVLWSQARNRS